MVRLNAGSAATVNLETQLTPTFGAAAVLVIAGLWLVNRPETIGAKVVPDPNVPA